jgi:hypothetical protein
MCDFPETPAETPTLREASYTLALFQKERELKSPKALLRREKGGDEGKFTCTSR